MELLAVEEEDRVDVLERARLPLADVVEDGVGDPREQVVADLDPVQLAQIAWMSRTLIPRPYMAMILSSKQVIREIRFLRLESPPRLQAGMCELCAESILDRRAHRCRRGPSHPASPLPEARVPG
jgi:hypothetical protein